MLVMKVKRCVALLRRAAALFILPLLLLVYLILTDTQQEATEDVHTAFFPRQSANTRPSYQKYNFTENDLDKRVSFTTGEFWLSRQRRASS